MKKTNENSWFEVIPSNFIDECMAKEDKPVDILQIESTDTVNDEGALLMLCEVIYK